MFITPKYNIYVDVMLWVWNVRKFIVRYVMGVLYRVMFMSHMKWFALCTHIVSCNTPICKCLSSFSVFLFYINILVQRMISFFVFFLSQLCNAYAIVLRVIA